jgi:hypothetical protein
LDHSGAVHRATALMIGLTIAAQAGPSPADVPLAGITLNGLD